MRFGAMTSTSMVILFAIMYLNTYEASHVRWSETRFYMTVVMGASIAAIMLTFMLGGYTNRRINTAIYVGGALVLAGALVLVRTQATVEDASYMRTMIPHHSIAILTSKNAGLDDARVRDLADEIIEAQHREIQEMEWLIEDIENNGAAETQAEAEARPVPNIEGVP